LIGGSLSGDQPLACTTVGRDEAMDCAWGNIGHDEASHPRSSAIPAYLDALRPDHHRAPRFFG